MKDQTTGFNGDNDPLDVCEIGSKIQERGAVLQVKVLGAVGLIDEGEADWKIIAIDVNDPLADKLDDIKDVEEHFPGLLDATRDWFRIYKIPTGKPANIFAENGKFYDRNFAVKQIEHDHELWSNVIKGCYDAEPGKAKGASLLNTTLAYSKNKVSNEEAEKAVTADSVEYNAQPAQIDRLPIDAVHYVDRNKI